MEKQSQRKEQKKMDAQMSKYKMYRKAQSLPTSHCKFVIMAAVNIEARQMPMMRTTAAHTRLLRGMYRIGTDVASIRETSPQDRYGHGKHQEKFSLAEHQGKLKSMASMRAA
jgi:hypothetical protein